MNHITIMPTQLHTILPSYTSMPVKLITEDLQIEPNHVFIIPANRDLHVDGDGATAMCAIQNIGGTTIAQKPSTASQPDMPESAMASGCIDFVLSPEDIAKEIISIACAELGPHPSTQGKIP